MREILNIIAMLLITLEINYCYNTKLLKLCVLWLIPFTSFAINIWYDSLPLIIIATSTTLILVEIMKRRDK